VVVRRTCWLALNIFKLPFCKTEPSRDELPRRGKAVCRNSRNLSAKAECVQGRDPSRPGAVPPTPETAAAGRKRAAVGSRRRPRRRFGTRGADGRPQLLRLRRVDRNTLRRNQVSSTGIRTLLRLIFNSMGLPLGVILANRDALLS
jgi:hypothetical protein